MASLRITGVAIKATKIAMTMKNIGTYLIMMARRFFLSLMLKIGACICFDGRSQKRQIE